MKRNLFILLILFSSQLTAQIFVKDVETVKVVTVAYCVDNEGEIYDVKIDEEKTNYDHVGWQLGVLENFKKSTLQYPMKMTNRCWTAVYYFVNEKYKTTTLDKDKQKECRKFHTGTYQYLSPAYSETKIIRRKNRQIEKNSKQRQVYKVEWLDDHVYTLETLFLPLEKDKHKIGSLIHVEIIEVFGDVYLYKSIITNKENDNYIFGLMKKVK